MEADLRVPSGIITPRRQSRSSSPVHTGPISFEGLIARLHELFAEGQDVDPEDVKDLLRSYKSNPSHWKKYCHFDPIKYTRNLINDGNGRFNVILLCWMMGQSSPIHDHAGSHCFVKVLQGNLLEENYAKPTDMHDGSPLIASSSQVYQLDQATYISDAIATHRMGNASHTEEACTLHIYCPAYKECRSYDQFTSTPKLCGPMTFHSKFGTIL